MFRVDDSSFARSSVMRNAWITKVVMTTAASIFLLQTGLGAGMTGSDEGKSVDGDSRGLRGPFTLSTTLGLQCPSCDRIHCTPRRASKLRCKGGISRGICNCCPVCAKTEGESCGGQWNYLGKCDVELFCEAETDKNLVNPEYETETLTSVWYEGKCRKRLAMSDAPVAVNSKCYPKCTAELCRSQPKALCSAIDNAERKQPCQAECPHTSCAACTYIRPEAECVKCRKDDFSCIRKFGRCIRRLHCNRTKLSCRTDKDDKKLKFQCLVPSCLVP